MARDSTRRDTMAGGGGVLGGAGGKSSKGKKNAPEEKKRALRPGDLPPRRGRAWNPGAGPRPEREGGGGGGDGENQRLSNVWHEASDSLALPSKAVKNAKELPQKDIHAKESVAIKALEERTAHH
jgi:ribosome biogenesis protein MAK21